MVLSLRTKTRKSPLVQLEYNVHIQEIKPWPPSQSLRTLRAVLIQWDHGENSSGFTNQVVPSLGTGSGAGDGRIEFNESFKLPVTLMREMSNKGVDVDTYQKNCIEFNLYEPRRDKVARGQLLASAVLDLAAYGVVKENLSLSVPINCKRTYRNAVQPLLFLKIQPVEMSASSRNSLTREASMERSCGESVSALMSEEYAEEAEVASFTTEDDVSSHSSLGVSAADSSGSSSHLNIKNETENGNFGDAKIDQVPHRLVGKSGEEQTTEAHLNTVGNSSRSSSMGLSSDITWISKRIKSPILHSSALKEMEKLQNSSVKIHECEKEGIFSRPISKESSTELMQQKDKLVGSGFTLLHDDNASSTGAVDILVPGRTNPPLNGFQDNDTNKKHGEKRRVMEERGQKIENEPHSDFSQVDNQKEVILENGSNIDKSKNGKSVRSSMEYSKSSGSTRSNHSLVVDTARTKVYRKETRSLLSDSRIQHMENRIKILEGELREAAAIEVSLYSVVAEHGSSMNKVHAPARRLSRLYFHANKQNPKSGRANAAKAIVSGLVLVAKACGNDVPRLTFWLSNAIVLRVISNGHMPISVGRGNVKVDKNGKKIVSPLKLETFPSKSTRDAIGDNAGDWENPFMFVSALEKIESWIFSRIIESLWWQTFTPHMQSGAAKAIRRSMDSASSKLYKRTLSSIDQQQGNFSMELWKKAFRDACERICPVRAGGHECRCLPVLSRLIMEQLIARLDVAMFNAILRESADDIPTDPVADPISDAKVLPIPAGKASFGAGAQLKNAIGNWSRWLTDLSGIDDDEMLENENPETAQKEEQRSRDTSPKPFHLLNSLSDLMMLPKDMLLSRAVRKEVCPAFGAPVIIKIIKSFVPDEFCPDPIPGAIVEALNSEDPLDLEEDSIMNLPCEAAPIEYQTPSASSVASVLGEISNPSKLKRSGSSLLKKSQTSDDELDELDSPLKAVFLDNHLQSSPSSGRRNTVRYQLLRELWRMDAQ